MTMSCTFKMGKMVNFMLFIFYHNKNVFKVNQFLYGQISPHAMYSIATAFLQESSV